MSTNTTNYNLTKQDKTEFYDVQIVNENLDKIDLAIKEAKDSASNIDLSQIEQSIEDVQNEVNQHLAQNDVIKHKATQISVVNPETEDVQPLQTFAEELFTSVSNGKQLIGTAITDIDSSVEVPQNPTFEDLTIAIQDMSAVKTPNSRVMTVHFTSDVAKGDLVNLYNEATLLSTPFDIAPSYSADNFSGAAFSKDDKYLVITGRQTSSAPVTLYEFNETQEKFIKLPALDFPGDSTPGTPSFSDEYLAIPSTAGDKINIYRIDSGFVKITNIDILPSGFALHARFSPDGDYLAVLHMTTPFITVYKVDKVNNSFVKLPNPTVLPASVSSTTSKNTTLTFDKTGKFLIITVASTMTVYKLESDNLEKVSNPTAPSTAYSVAVSPENKIVYSYGTAPFVWGYDLDELGAFSTLAVSALRGGYLSSFSADGALFITPSNPQGSNAYTPDLFTITNNSLRLSTANVGTSAIRYSLFSNTFKNLILQYTTNTSNPATIYKQKVKALKSEGLTVDNDVELLGLAVSKGNKNSNEIGEVKILCL